MLTLEGATPPSHRGGVGRAVGFLRPYLFGLASAAYLFTVGWLRRRNRGIIVRLGSEFGHRYDVRERPDIPAIGFEELTGPPIPIDVRALDSIDGNVTDRELTAICRLAAQAGAAAIFEIGTFDGRTTLNLAANSPAASSVYTLDLPRNAATSAARPLHPDEIAFASARESGTRFKGADVEGKIVQLCGDSATFDFSPYYGTVDFVFVDGSHVYDYVINDSLQALRLLRRGRGLILWHDYSRWDGVTSALNDLRRRHAAFARLRWLDGTTLAALKL